MSKIKIKMFLQTPKEKIKRELKGTIQNGKISYFEDQTKVNIWIKKEMITLIRRTLEYQITLTFQKSLTIHGKYDIKNIGILELKTKTKELKISDHNIYIKYILYINGENLGQNIYQLEYEEIP